MTAKIARRAPEPKLLTSIVPQTFGEQFLALLDAPKPVRGRTASAAVLEEHAFTATYERRAAPGGGVGQWLKQQAEAVGKGDLVNLSYDWDGAFERVIRNVVNTSGRHRNNPEYVKDLKHEIMIKMNSAKIAQFDPEKNPNVSFESFILTWVRKRTMDFLRGDHDVNRRKELPPSDDGEGSNDPLDTLSGPDNSTEFNLDYEQMVREIFDFLSKTNRPEWYTKIFRYALQGESSVDIARKEGVSSGIISRYVKGMEEELKKYAESTDNDLLLRLLQNKTTRRHMLTRYAADELLEIGTALEKYKQMSQRQSSVIAKQIKVVHKDDLLSPDIMGAFIQSQYVGDTQLSKDVEAFVNEIRRAEDIVESSEGELAFLFSDKPKDDIDLNGYGDDQTED